MPQRGTPLVSTLFVLVLVVGSWATGTGAVRAADECIAAPNAPAPQGERWYYRTDRATNRKCWRLGPEGASVQKSATEAAKQPASDAPPPAPPRVQMPSTLLRGAPAAVEAEVAAPTAPPRASEAAKLADVPPPFEPAPQPTLEKAPGSTDAIGLAPASKPQSPANGQSSRAVALAQAAGDADHTFAVIMISLALLGIAGPMFHVMRSGRRHNASDRQDLGRPRPSIANTSYPSLDSAMETAALHIPPPLKPFDRTAFKETEQQVAQALQQLLNEAQTKRAHVASNGQY